ncbi:MAG: hypothetical protein K0R08_1381 [Solimicrobium sp.]|jgi:hypothetical protein|nr:hypothetical protein [Solimicrobium sp.]
MQLSLFKSLLNLVFVIITSHLVAPVVYAGAAYLRVQDTDGKTPFSSYINSGSIIFNELNKNSLGGAAYSNLGIGIPPYLNDNYKTYYIVMPGYEKRFGVFKLQKSTNGEKDGPKEDLVFKTKKEANDFCTELSRAAGDFEYSKLDKEGTAFVSDYVGGLQQVIAVAYSVPYQGDLTPSKKHVFCSNHWKVANNYWNKPDPNYFDENEITGVKASGFINGNKNKYQVVCMNDQMPETSFLSTSHWEWSNFMWVHVTTWTNGNYSYDASGTAIEERPSLEQIDAGVGTRYCSQSA